MVRVATPLGCELLPAEALRTLLQSIERTGYDAAPLIKGLELELRDLVSTEASTPWKTLVALATRFVAHAGQAEFDRVARDVAVSMPALRKLGSLLLPPKAFYRVLAQAWARPCFWSLRFEEANSQVTVNLELKRSVEGCAPVLTALGAMLGATPRLMNLPDVEVEVRVHSAHTARYLFELPKGKSLTVRLNEAQLSALVHQLGDRHQHGTDNAMPSIATLETRFGLTRAEGRVVRRLGAGSSLTEIARELGVGTETVRTHTKRAMQKTDTHRQAELVALVLRRAPGRDSDER